MLPSVRAALESTGKELPAASGAGLLAVLLDRPAMRVRLRRPTTILGPTVPRPSGKPAHPLPWDELLCRVFDEDVLTCSACGGPRHVVAILADHKQAHATLAELGVSFLPLLVRKARGPPLQLDLPSPARRDGLHPALHD